MLSKVVLPLHFCFLIIQDIVCYAFVEEICQLGLRDENVRSVLPGSFPFVIVLSVRFTILLSDRGEKMDFLKRLLLFG